MKKAFINIAAVMMGVVMVISLIPLHAMAAEPSQVTDTEEEELLVGDEETVLPPGSEEAEWDIASEEVELPAGPEEAELILESQESEAVVKLEESGNAEYIGASLTAMDTGAAADAAALAVGLAGAIIKMTPEAAAGAVVEWGVEKLLDVIFNEAFGEKEDPVMKEILEGIEELQSEVGVLQNTINSQQLDDLLNAYKQLDNATPSVIFASLKDIENSSRTPEEKKYARLRALTDDINISEISSINNSFDNYAVALAKAMLTTYHVTLDGQPQDLTLLEIYYEHLRYAYHWEHQSYQAWDSFDAYAVGLLVSTLVLEKASLQARLTLITEWNNDPAHKDPKDQKNPESVTELLKKIQGYLNDVKDKYSSLDWVAKRHDDSVRYYWVPKHEIVFYADVNTQNVPHERKKSIGCASPDAGGFIKHQTYYGYWDEPRFSFWQPFLHYNGEDNTLLISYDQLKTIRNDYKDTGKSFYDIFIGEGEGNFRGLSGEAKEDWKMVIDPGKGYEIEYRDRLFYADQIRCHMVNAKSTGNNMPKADWEVLCYYHSNSNESNDNTNYIGIGIKSIGKDSENQQEVSVHTAATVDTGSWAKAREDFVVEPDGELHSAITEVTIDGAVPDDTQYEVADDGRSVALKAAYLKELAEAEHEIFIRTDAGGLTLNCSRQSIFPDVADPAKYYYKPVCWAANKGITGGYSDGLFRPQASCTRAQFVLMLWKFAGKPKGRAKVNFSDVSTDLSVYKALQWAVGTGVIKGYRDGTFRPGSPVTRRQTAIMLWKYGGKPSASKTALFADVTSSDRAFKAVQWGAAKGWIKGSKGSSGEKLFKPKDPCTRQQIVTFLYRYERVVK